MFNGAKQKRHRQHIHCRYESPDQRHIGAIEIDGPGTGLLNRFVFLAELVVMKDADPVAAPTAFRDQASHVTRRLYRRIILALGIGSAKFARDRARRDRRQEQRDNECSGPRRFGAAVYRQLQPLMMMSMVRKKGSRLF